jgi:hypothetical protein
MDGQLPHQTARSALSALGSAGFGGSERDCGVPAGRPAGSAALSVLGGPRCSSVEARLPLQLVCSARVLLVECQAYSVRLHVSALMSTRLPQML